MTTSVSTRITTMLGLEFVRKVIRRLVIRPVNRVQEYSVQTCKRAARYSPSLCRFFATVIGSRCSTEQYRFLRGRWRHQRGQGQVYFLRRSVHRVEKGLMMPKRKEVFALGYILPTVKVLQRHCGDDERVSNTEYSWFHSVLSRYFEVVAGPEVVEKARAVFEELPEPPDNPGAGRTPFESAERPSSDIGPGELLDLSRQRKSVRWYQDRQVPRRLLDRAVDIARQAPSACNRQPFHFWIFDDPDLVADIADIPMGLSGCDREPPVLIAVVGEQRAFEHERDRHVIYIDGSLAAMNLMLALETLGLASCPVNWPDIPEKEKELRDTIDLDADQQVVMFLTAGYPNPDGKVAWSERKPVERMRRYNAE